MQALTSLLPGIRHMRVPVITGYVWLLFGWILVQPDVGHRPNDQVAGSLYDLSGEVGPIGTAIGLSVFAFILGSASRDGTNAFVWSFGVFRFSTVAQLLGFVPPTADDQRGPVLLALRQLYEDAEAVVARKGLEPRVGLAVKGALDEAFDTAAKGVVTAVDLPATLLVGDQPELYAEVDRLRAEGELQLAICVPLAAIVVALAIIDSNAWLVALPIPVLLATGGIRQTLHSRRLTADAITVGRVRSPSVVRFENWVATIDDVVEHEVQVLGRGE